MNYECCVCDMDGTLLNDTGRISEENIEALKLLTQNGCKVVIATGRTDLMIKEHIHRIGIRTPVIACNGALIRDMLTGAVLYRKRIDPAVALGIIEYCDLAGMDYLVYTSDMIYYSEDSKRMGIFAAYNLNAAEEFRVPLKEIKYFKSSRDVCKILISGQELSMMEELNLLFNRDGKLSMVSSGKGLIDIMSAGVSKGKALCRLAQKLNVKLEKTVVFGDSFNDISMFKVAGLKIAVANAEETLKEEADYVTLSNEASGVSYGICKYVLEKDQK